MHRDSIRKHMKCYLQVLPTAKQKEKRVVLEIICFNETY